MLLALDVLLIIFYYLLLRVFPEYLSLYSMYVTMSISIGLYPNLDLWNANKLHYITLHVRRRALFQQHRDANCHQVFSPCKARRRRKFTPF